MHVWDRRKKNHGLGGGGRAVVLQPQGVLLFFILDIIFSFSFSTTWVGAGERVGRSYLCSGRCLLCLSCFFFCGSLRKRSHLTQSPLGTWSRKSMLLSLSCSLVGQTCACSVARSPLPCSVGCTPPRSAGTVAVANINERGGCVWGWGEKNPLLSSHQSSGIHCVPSPTHPLYPSLSFSLSLSRSLSLSLALSPTSYPTPTHIPHHIPVPTSVPQT